MRLVGGSYMMIKDAVRLSGLAEKALVGCFDGGLIKGRHLADLKTWRRRFTPEAFRAFLVAQGLSTEAFDAEMATITKTPEPAR